MYALGWLRNNAIYDYTICLLLIEDASMALETLQQGETRC